LPQAFPRAFGISFKCGNILPFVASTSGALERIAASNGKE
jgi:hypothetical protein